MKRIGLVFLPFIILPLSIFALVGEGTYGSFTMDTVNPEVTVNSPNGGEELYIGDSHNIIWNATDYELATNSVTILYSSNNGNDYDILDSLEVNDGTYSWELPSITSLVNLVKIKTEDNFGNIGEDISNAVFSIIYEGVPPAPPESIIIDISNEIDAIITWTEVDTTINGNPIAIDGYIVLYNETVCEDSINCYYFLAATNSATTSYTHLRVAEFRDQMFYIVVAYKDYRGNIERTLTEIANPNNFLFDELEINRLSWNELKRRFK